jgi:hypothetical protein
MLEPAGSFGVWLKEDLTTEGTEEDEAAKLARHGRVVERATARCVRARVCGSG